MHDVQRLEESAAELREVMRVAERVLGARSQVTLDATSNLAGVMTDMGAYAEAEVLLRRVLAAQGWLGEGGGPGSGTLDSLTLRGNLAMVMAEQGKPDEAIAMMRELVEDMRVALGPTHHSTLTTRSNLAENLRRAGRTEESLAMMKSLLDDSVAGLGWSHPTTLDQANGLAAFYVRQRRFEEAFAIASEALGHIERLLGREHEFWHRMRLMVASANSGLGRHAEAIAAYADEVAYYEGAFGREHRRTLEATNNFGTTLIEAGEGVRAVEVLESVLSRVGEGRFESMESVVRRNYGRALVIAGRLADAERELVRAYENSTARGEADNAGVCARHLAKLFEARGDAAAAAVWNDRVPR
jgi:tetratricopeptide (TPR) repeat protein